jgi:hypothetical protein
MPVISISDSTYLFGVIMVMVMEQGAISPLSE